VHRLKSWRQAWIGGSAEPCWSGCTAGKASPEPEHHENVQQSIEDRLLARFGVKAPIANLADFAALDPFFRIIEHGLAGLAGPGHFFDLLAEDVTVDYVVTVPGYPRHIKGRAAVAELYRPYGTMIMLDRCFDLAVHHDAAKGVVVLEYASEGRVVGTGRRYANRYISVLTLREGEVAHWRDYLDPVAVFDAVGWPPR
jgi:ketosteroid isomerase-like protein